MSIVFPLRPLRFHRCMKNRKYHRNDGIFSSCNFGRLRFEEIRTMIVASFDFLRDRKLRRIGSGTQPPALVLAIRTSILKNTRPLTVVEPNAYCMRWHQELYKYCCTVTRYSTSENCRFARSWGISVAMRQCSFISICCSVQVLELQSSRHLVGYSSEASGQFLTWPEKYIDKSAPLWIRDRLSFFLVSSRLRSFTTEVISKCTACLIEEPYWKLAPRCDYDNDICCRSVV